MNCSSQSAFPNMNSSSQGTIPTMDTTTRLWDISTVVQNASQPLGSDFFPAWNLTPPMGSSRGWGGIPEDVIFKQKVQRYAYGYLMLAVCGTGVIGNLLTLAVLSRRTMRSSHTVAYLRSLAVVDACVLVLAVFRYRSYYVLLSEREVIRVIMNFDRYVQVYVVPFFWICLAVSSYIILSLSLERYLVIRWPFTLRKTRWVTVVRTGSGVAVAGIFMVTLPILLCYRMQHATFRGLQVTAVRVSDRYLHHARSYLYAYNHYVIPLAWYAGPWLAVAIVNALLFRQVQKSSRIRVGVPNSLNPNRNLSVLIILIVGVYMFCNLPRSVLALYCLGDRCGTNTDGEDVGTRGFLLLRVVADLLNVLHSALNILVYCFTGTKFRREVKGLVLCRWWCRPNAVTPATHQSVHVSLREVPATPLDSPDSAHFSFRDLQLPSLPGLLLSPGRSRPCPDMPPVTLCSSCPQSSLHDGGDNSASTAASGGGGAAAGVGAAVPPSSSSSSSSSSNLDLDDPHSKSTTLSQKLPSRKAGSFDAVAAVSSSSSSSSSCSRFHYDPDDPLKSTTSTLSQKPRQPQKAESFENDGHLVVQNV